MAEQKKQQGPPSVSFNSFIKGMNKDVAKYILPPDTYYDGQNIRVTAAHEKEGAAVVNIEGNKFITEIPCSPVATSLEMRDAIVLQETWETTSWLIQCYIYTSEGTYTRQFEGVGGNCIGVIHDALVSDSPGFTIDGVAAPDGGKLPENIKFTFDFSRYVLTFWSGGGTPLLNSVNVSATGGNYTKSTTLGGKLCDLEIIGYTTIRDDIYLFTTNYDGGSPEAEGGAGQIWKLQYDVSTLQVTWECIYNNNNINFTKQHPIQALGRYENAGEQGVYWTDFFNPPRKINVASPSAMAIDSKFLDLAPVTKFQIPTLNKVSEGGLLSAGTYQIAYRYKSYEGLVSNWSPMSNKVSIYGDEESDPFCNIEGDEIDLDAADLPGVDTSKRIEWKLRDLDTTYDLIEFGAVYMKTNGYDPLLHKYYTFKDAPNILEDITVEHTGTENMIQISPTEFQEGIGATFEKVKTLASKDNKLFLGNIVNTSFHIDFDARVYRFQRHDGNTVARLESESDLPRLINAANLYDADPTSGYTNIDVIPEIHDCICPFNDENLDTNPNWYTDDQYVFQANGQILGGTGPNISYRFVNQPMKGDDAQMDSAQYDNFTGDVMGYGYTGGLVNDWFLDTNCDLYSPDPNESCIVVPNETSAAIESLGVPAQLYPMNGSVENFKSVYQYSLYEGYARGETYRFGIVFYNSKGSPSTVTWIGDIKFPFSYQHDDGEEIGQFAVQDWRPIGQWNSWVDYSNYGFRGEMWLNSIGIEFNLDLSGIDLLGLGITGYSIVRCERKETDKSRFGHALSWQVHKIRKKTTGRAVMDQGGSPWTSYKNLIPAGNFTISGGSCTAFGLWSCDAGVDDHILPWYTGGTTCDEVQITMQQNILLYGPVAWKNSTVEQLYNTDYDIPFVGGDYLKIESVMAPQMNGRFGKLPVFGPEGGVGGVYSFFDSDQATGQWYKYYHGVTIAANPSGAGGAGWNANVGYHLGTPTNTDPADIKIPLQFAHWVGDGKTLDKNLENAMAHDFINVTNLPDPDYSIGEDDGWGACNRPRSIGSECVFAVSEQDIPWPDMGMGSGHVIDGHTAGCITRCIVSYERYNKPYGGPTYAERSKSIYISANHYSPITAPMLYIPDLISDITNTVFGGDVTVNIVDFTQQEKNWGQSKFNDKFKTLAEHGDPTELDLTDNNIYGLMRGCIYPAEVHPVNPEYRKGYHFASKGGGNNPYPDDGTNLHDEYRHLSGYKAVANIKSYIPLPLDFNVNEEFDTRVYYSETKVNGESADSWAVYKVGNFHDVESIQGPINNLIVHQDKMFFNQDKGFGVLNINPNAIVQGVDGTELQLGHVTSGTGAFIQSYQYITNQFGAKHQWAITKSNNSIYFFDALKKKLFRYDSQGLAQLSDISGLSSWFKDNLKGDVLKVDNPILRQGITSTFDNKNSEAIFTFHDKNVNTSYRTQVIMHDQIMNVYAVILRTLDECNTCFHMDCPESAADLATWPVPDLYLDGQNIGPGTMLGIIGCPGSVQVYPMQYGDIVVAIPYFEGLSELLEGNPVIEMSCPAGEDSYTIAYNEMVGAFTSFYDFTPSIYVNDGQRIITPNTENLCYTSENIWNTSYKKDRLYMHDVGSYSTFYGVTLASKLTLISNEGVILSKAFDNVSFHMESLMTDKEPEISDYDVQYDVFDRIRFYTDYQTTGWIETNTGDVYGERNIRKVEREWQMAIPRNVMAENPINMDLFNTDNYDPDRLFKDRLRDKYLMIELLYDNIDNITGGAKNIKFILHYFRTFFRASSR